jgi:hypothetical protein
MEVRETPLPLQKVPRLRLHRGAPGGRVGVREPGASHPRVDLGVKGQAAPHLAGRGGPAADHVQVGEGQRKAGAGGAGKLVRGRGGENDDAPRPPQGAQLLPLGHRGHADGVKLAGGELGAHHPQHRGHAQAVRVRLEHGDHGGVRPGGILHAPQVAPQRRLVHLYPGPGNHR